MQEKTNIKRKAFLAGKEKLIKWTLVVVFSGKEKEWLTLGPTSPWSPCEKNRKITVIRRCYQCKGTQDEVCNKNIATVEQLWQKGFQTNTEIRGAAERSSVAKPAHQVNIYCMNHLIDHNLLGRDGSKSGSARAGHCWFADLEFMLMCRATSMITWRETILPTKASSVICNHQTENPLWQMLFTALVLEGL